MQLGEFSEALEILNEWRMLIDPEVRLKLILSNNYLKKTISAVTWNTCRTSRSKWSMRKWINFGQPYAIFPRKTIHENIRNYWRHAKFYREEIETFSEISEKKKSWKRNWLVKHKVYKIVGILLFNQVVARFSRNSLVLTLKLGFAS